MHYIHYHKSQVGGLLRHDERKNKNYENTDIDPSKTYLNYNLAPYEDEYSHYKERLSEVRCLNRDDVNTMCSWVVQAPKDLRPEDEEKFFENVYKFFCDKYGEKNVISAWVHKDEPGEDHIHFKFIPVVAMEHKRVMKDPETGEPVIDPETGKKIKETYYEPTVSAHAAVSRQDLKEMHPNMTKYIEEALGYSVSIETGETSVKGNKSIDKLKDEQLKKDIAKQEKTISEQETTIKERNDELADLVPEKLDENVKKPKIFNRGYVLVPEQTYDDFKPALSQADRLNSIHEEQKTAKQMQRLANDMQNEATQVLEQAKRDREAMLKEAETEAQAIIDKANAERDKINKDISRLMVERDTLDEEVEQAFNEQFEDYKEVMAPQVEKALDEVIGEQVKQRYYDSNLYLDRVLSNLKDNYPDTYEAIKEDDAKTLEYCERQIDHTRPSFEAEARRSRGRGR